MTRFIGDRCQIKYVTCDILRAKILWPKPQAMNKGKCWEMNWSCPVDWVLFLMFCFIPKHIFKANILWWDILFIFFFETLKCSNRNPVFQVIYITFFRSELLNFF